MPGDDTKCTVTILDEDSPGVLSFEERHIKVRRKDQKCYLKVNRKEGCDGVVRVQVQTEVISHIDNQA